MKTPLGQILVESGIITVKTLERALGRQQGSDKRLGIILDEMGVITQDELIEALAKQSGLETVKGIAAGSFADELLKLIPQDVALHRQVFPLSRQGSVLALAITDPLDTDTIEFLEKQSALKIVPVLATRDDILDALHQHYLRSETEANSSLKILVVDDSLEVSAEIAEALEKEGYQVLTANDGVDGLKIAFSLKPDLILCGASMPRMDGYALMRAVKANPATSGTPMILLTFKASPEEKHRALKSGFHDFIAKPMMAIRVVSRVRRAFEIVEREKGQQAVPAA
jgi:CheY-like chemotaxis protein